MWRPFLRLDPLSVFPHARLPPFLDQANDPLISDPMLHELDQPVLIDFVETGLNVQIQHPVHFLLRDSDVQRIQRVMLAAPRPESVRKSLEVLFPDRVEYFPYRSLYDFIFQRRDSQWSLPSI